MKSTLLSFILIINSFYLIAQQSKLSPNEYESNKVIVKYKDFPSDHQVSSLSSSNKGDFAINSQKSFFRNSDNLSNSRTQESLPEVYKIYELEIETSLAIEEVILKLMENESIEYAEPAYTYELLDTPNDPLYSSQLMADLFSIEGVWKLTKGDSNLVIGIIDTGTELGHEDLANNLYFNQAEKEGLPNVDDDGNGYIDDITGYDFAEEDNDPSIDRSTHGLSVAGTAVAISDNGVGISGVAPLCKYMPLKVETTSGSLINISEAMIYAAMNGCKVINLSLGRAFNPARYEQEIINYLTETYDVLFVAAAGNNSASHTDYYPASYDNVLSVTGLKQNYNNLDYKYSHKIDVANLGSNVHVTRANNTYGTSAGTSYASPLTAGVAALIASYDKSLTMSQVGELIRTTADTSIYQNSTNSSLQGYLGRGFVKPLNALNRLDEAISVRMEDISAFSSRGDIIELNDEFFINGQFKNYLNSTSSQLNVQIESNSTAFEILEGNFNIGALNELEKTELDQTVFKIKLIEDVSEGSRFSFKLIFSDPNNNYYDEQYFYITPKESKILLYLNNFAGYFKSDGSLGYPSSFYHKSSGYRRFMYQFSAVIAQDENSVSDAIRNEDDLYADTDFSSNHSPSYYERENHRASVYTAFNDYQRGSETSNNVDVELIAYGNKDDEKDDFILIDLKLTNTSDQTIDSLYAGMYIDWLLSGSTSVRNTDVASWDSSKDYVYAYNTGISKYAAFKVLNEDRFYKSFDQESGNQDIDLSDGFSDSEKFSLMSDQIDDSVIGGASGANVGSMLGAKLYGISPQESQRVVFILAITTVNKTKVEAILAEAEEFAQDFLNLPFADTYWDGTQWVNGTPSSDRVVRIEQNSPNTSFSAKKLILESDVSLNIPKGEEVRISESIVSDNSKITGGGSLYLTNPNGEIEVINTLNISNVLELEANTTLNTNSNLNFEDGAVLLHEISSQIEGNTTFKRTGHGEGVNAYNYLSLPVTSRNLHDSISSTDRYYFDEEGTDDGINDNGNDPSYTPNDMSDDVWKVFNEGNQLEIGKGFIASDIGNVSITGEPITGTYAVGVSSTQTGFNLLGNPYMAPINVESFLTHSANSELEGSVWVYTSNSEGKGCYDCFNLLNTGEIPTFQGFFVKANSAGEVEFTNEMKVRSRESNSLKRVNHGGTGFSIFELHVEKQDGISDKVILGFDYIFSENFDENYDARKLRGTQDLDVFIEIDEVEHSIVAWPPVEDLKIFNLNIESESAEQFSFHYTVREDHLVPEGVFIKDNVNNSYTLLDDSEDTFTVEVLENDPPNRFQLLLVENLDQILAVQQGLEELLDIRVGANRIVLSGQILTQNRELQVSVFNLLGQKVMAKKLSDSSLSSSVDIDHDLRKNQPYILQIGVGNQFINKKIILK
ncbi:S8 family serine peptidase [Sediminitomix flava]|uniref:Subtilase family protein n=1 Tax=Sediminitomix flava TaxID=379075 RepID=A0A315Z8G7_SEDFL|nr:S8 family serine peptidase [Sediminitomix flava]PWJ40225.1 subtilase family protein [Sediminitomix flava]